MTALRHAHPGPDPVDTLSRLSPAPAQPAIALPGELPGSITAGVLLAVGLAAKWSGVEGTLATVGVVAVWSSLAIGLVYGGRAAWEAIREWKFDIDVLMVLAAAAAGAMSHPEDGALLLFLFVLAGALEHRAMQRTKRAVEALHKLMPTRAMVQRGGQWGETEPATLRVGERIRVRSGELVPADARIDSGASAFDQATLTGESMPRSAHEGDTIYAGTLNVENPVEAVVLRPSSESSLQRVLDLVMTAQQQREPLQRAIDRLSQPYAIGVTLISGAVFLGWWLLLGFTAEQAARVAVALLIVGSPCALVIATPTATLAAISRAARAGLLFKGGQAIERLARMGAVCVDKTGTLTLGRPRLREVHVAGGADGAAMLELAAALEAGSTHPIALAVVEEARSRSLTPAPATGIADLPGRGLSGTVEGTPARLGTFEHCEPLIAPDHREHLRGLLDGARSGGRLGVVVASASGDAAVLVLADQVRPGARELVERLHALGVRPVRMLTGDHRTTAAQVAAELGIDQWEAGLLPEDKVRILGEMRRGRAQASPLAMGALTARGAARLATGVGVIGDGVNDAPALAGADVSIAIGSIGADAAVESADIVLLNDDLTVIPWALRLARRTRAIVLFNLTLAMTVIVVMATAAIVGSLTAGRWIMPLPLAVLTHEGGTLLVVANSLRLLGVRRHPGAPERHDGTEIRFESASAAPAIARP